MPIKSKQITPLPRPTWLDKAGMSKGVDHDRHHLGIVLAPGQTIKARQTNPAFKSDLTLRLLNDDAHTETSKKFGTSWTSVSVNSVSVPFIDTPYYDKPEGNVQPVVEYDFPDGSKTLPIYRKGDDEKAFFALWDSVGAEFALINSAVASVLVPVVDKEALRHKSIDGLIEYYESLFAFYNSLAGLSFEPEFDSDLNISNRYFMKADIHGAGGAYYGHEWTAASTNAIKGWWLDPLATNWGNLHEIGHGYQASFRNDRYFWNGEVSNNIYAACYQSAMLGDRKYKEGWLYNYGKQAQVEKGITDNSQAKLGLNEWDLRAKLYFLVMMIDKAGWDSFADFNRQYRLASNSPGFKVADYLILDMLSESFIRVANLDVTPFVQLCNGVISSTQLQRNHFSQARAVYPLSGLVESDTLTKLQTELKLQSPLDLVEVSQLLASGVTGDVRLSLNINDFSQIYGKSILLLVGSRVVRNVMIQESVVSLSGLTIGAYTLRLPTGRNDKYQTPNDRYLVVKPGLEEVKVDFEPKTGSLVVSQEIKLLGLGDDLFSTIQVDQVNHIVEVAVTEKEPHSYFGDQTYAQIIIKDKSGTEKLRVTMPGKGATLSNDKIPFEPGYTLEVHHEEPSHRIQLSPDFDGVIDHTKKINTFEITASGLKNQALNNDPLKALLPRIEAAATELRSRPFMLRADSPAKLDIWLAINLYSGSQRDDLLKQYADCLPTDNDPPVEGLGNAFTVDFKGIGDRQFLKVDVDLNTRKLTVHLESGVAHHYFDDTYASLQYIDADGTEQLNLDIKGSKDQKAGQWPFPISGYGEEVLKIRHEEPKNRLVVTNNMQNRRLSDREKLQDYRITPTGLELIQ
ncbi:peptidase M60, viral enhancin protein [Aspergillus steynii IBT 23096]|uniref:Peptidase M60, viral enhancin protein n=1 Tax=Aspergillus steynii IBT 23096 TaxID=1392250 RepID=A0A2I2GPW1_9EURO|nr:peptidase M60, viral enhancin protein [Aspergillus steynii IBT 23096]PLB54911.1 peptidase M60, viral enhancin protein [Aspergillus steynii IBT 23096]